MKIGCKIVLRTQTWKPDTGPDAKGFRFPDTMFVFLIVMIEKGFIIALQTQDDYSRWHPENKIRKILVA